MATNTITPAVVGGLVERLLIDRFDLDEGGFLGDKGRMEPDATGEWVRYSDALNAISAQKTIIAVKDADAIAARKAASNNFASLASERAAHAETKRELARAQEFERQHDYCCCGSRMTDHDVGSGHSPVSQYEYDFTQAIDRAEAAEARLAEVLKALDKAENAACRGLDEGDTREALIEIKSDLRAARRSLKGGRNA